MDETRDNIILIGLPTSGKSTVGVVLAKILGMDFIDTDIIIQRREGSKLNEIIETYGIDGFLKLEEQALLSIDVSHTVIATGGSAVYSDNAMKHLSKNAKVVYLNISLEDLKKRLVDTKDRGVIIRPDESIDKMYESRSILYEKYSEITVTEEGSSIEDTIRAVINRLR